MASKRTKKPVAFRKNTIAEDIPTFLLNFYSKYNEAIKKNSPKLLAGIIGIAIIVLAYTPAFRDKVVDTIKRKIDNTPYTSEAQRKMGQFSSMFLEFIKRKQKVAQHLASYIMKIKQVDWVKIFSSMYNAFLSDLERTAVLPPDRAKVYLTGNTIKYLAIGLNAHKEKPKKPPTVWERAKIFLHLEKPPGKLSTKEQSELENKVVTFLRSAA